jgi:hypothetical protein
VPQWLATITCIVASRTSSCHPESTYALRNSATNASCVAHNCVVPLRVLLDTNIWAYVADQDAVAELRQVGRENDLDLLISPAVVFEQLRLQDELRRKKHLDITTRRW